MLGWIYKALYSLGPEYLKDHLLHYYPAHALHSAEKAVLCILPAAEARLAGTRGRAFSVAAPHLWNTLLWDAHLALLLVSFWLQVTEYLFRWAFN